VRDGKFHVWVAEDVDNGIPLLMNCAAGVADEEDVYPKDSLHRAVIDQLKEYAETLKAQSAATNGHGVGESPIRDTVRLS